jgi:hypothetical protein
MRKTILVLALAFLAFVAVASVTDPAARNNDGNDSKSRFYYVVHPYVAVRTYTVAPVYYYRPTVVVYPVYRVYPVYTYQYWYNRFAGPKEPQPQTQPQQQLIQGQGSQVEKSPDLKK